MPYSEALCSPHFGLKILLISVRQNYSFYDYVDDKEKKILFRQESAQTFR